jgi:hypothetical protein
MASAKTTSSKTETTAEPRENSVMFALSELAKLESDRLADERARTERRAEQARLEREREVAALAEAERRAKEREAQSRAVAEAEARLRVEAEVAQDTRMTAMRAELARVAQEREEMHRNVIESARTPAARPSSRAWPLAFGLSSVVAAALAGLVVMQAQSAPRVVEVERQVIVQVPVAAPSAPAPVVSATVAPAAAPVEVVDTASRPERARPDRVRADRVRTESSVQTTAHDDGLDFGEGDDVLGGLDHDETSMMGGRRRAR